MALNASSHNTPGEQTGPTTGPAPPASDETKLAILSAANGEPTGQTVPSGTAVGPSGNLNHPKSEEKIAKEKAREEQKQKKLAKLEAKKAKLAAQQPKEGKAKEKKKEASTSEVSEYVDETPRGHKKILKPLEDKFRPKAVESAWAAWWEREGFFQPQFDKDGNVKKNGKFVIVIPPPNVTGALHCGHAIGTALQDTLIRWNRMRGLTTLYVPGCDHAGIATQTVVEKMLWRKEKKTRHDLGRQAFVARTQDWKEEYHQRINAVLRRLGGSMDWSREAFTMSPELSRAVTETFVRLHDQGYIYRSNRLVNWCTRLNTALSNIEVENKELAGRTVLDVPGYDRKVEFGVITHFKYPIEGSDETIEVATTRPETMLGDSGIAVHPEDPRYKNFVGKVAYHPLIAGRKLPIVADTYVEMEFGTGAVKLTPAHDPNDFELGKKHGLEFINILNDDGTLNKNAGSYAGQRRFDARYTVVQALEEKGLFVKKDNNAMTVPVCSRSGDIIEPLVKPQWWMKMEEMTTSALDVVKDGRVKIKPESARKTYFDWMNKPQDWCLSRQLWWGHQIPAYRVKFQGEPADADETWVVGRDEKEARQRAAQEYSGRDYTLDRDEDVLDTWFSSGLWPFSTLGWPDKTLDLNKLFPTSLLETGWDILFFWVARMIMFSLKLTGEVPFTEVFCHSLIRDSEGRKMSKSLGNVIDPIDMLDGISLQGLHAKLLEGNLDPKEVKNAEKYQKSAFPQGIPECGADGTRYFLVQSTTPGGSDINIDMQNLDACRRFCNKMFQATKYAFLNFPERYTPPSSSRPTGKESLAEKWILHKLTIAARDINTALERREFSHACQIAYDYFRKHLCDVYIENSKSIISDGTPEEQQSARNTLYTAIEGGLAMFHPIMPFITEELWQRLPRRPNDETPSIMVAAYPEYHSDLEDARSERGYELVLGCAQGMRTLSGIGGFNMESYVVIQPFDATTRETALAQEPAIKTLGAPGGRAKPSIQVLDVGGRDPQGCLAYPVNTKATLWVPLRSLADPSEQLSKMEKRLEEVKDSKLENERLVAGMEKSEETDTSAKEAAKEGLSVLRAQEEAYGKNLELLKSMPKASA
ncbi:MAG: hypothetical protein Q9162_005860 [Coniocarpon cinnabarinum]